MDIKIELTKNPKPKPADETKLGFGHIFTDHMFVMDYDAGQGWHDARIVPYGPIELMPSAMVLHYGQEIFEGMKAYRTPSGDIQFFRPEENFKRMNVSAERLVIPQINEKDALEALHKLVEIDKDWVPHIEGASLYIRPFIFAADPFLGVRPGEKYYFMIIMSPSGAYYSTGINPVNIYVETNYVRAVRGGMGFTKTGGNYAASLAGQDEAHRQNYSQVLWLDGVERKYIEEVGAMNIMFVIDGEVVTPSLQGSILSGITRKSALELCRKWGMKVSERRITIQYAKRVVGRKQMGGQNSYLPLKLNMSGVMPIIFASALVSIPGTIGSFLQIDQAAHPFWYAFFHTFNYTSLLYIVIYLLLILAFNYFYVAIQYNPVEIANNLRRNNGSIPGFRPGKPTSDFITRTLNKITLIGAIFLAAVAVLPIILGNLTGMSIQLGGTSLLIVVGVALDTTRSLDSFMTMRNHKGFLG